MTKKLDTAPYKGVRDFYPEDMFIENYIFSIMRKTAENFGFLEYGASPLEPAEIYKAKSGEEIVSEQTYSFIDRGNREVTLRPEMTPTVARMVAGRQRDLSFPLRWYSIPNLFRYEQPQKGRLREHYQLNADIFGVEDISAELEIISLASAIMKNFGAKDSDFEIRINSRKMLDDLFRSFSLKDETVKKLAKIIDKKEKIGRDVYENSVRDLVGKEADELIRVLDVNQRILDRLGGENKNVKNLENLIESLSKLNIKNIFFSPTLMRGFDYYTDIVFEIFDTSPDNKRSLFGGGRYDSLTELFGGKEIPAVGFGMGDVTLLDFLESRNLLPENKTSTQIYLCGIGKIESLEIFILANELRKKGLNTAIDLTSKKTGDKIKTAIKNGIPFVVFVGEDEIKNKKYKIKELETGEEKSVGLEEIESFVKK